MLTPALADQQRPKPTAALNVHWLNSIPIDREIRAWTDLPVLLTIIIIYFPISTAKRRRGVFRVSDALSDYPCWRVEGASSLLFFFSSHLLFKKYKSHSSSLLLYYLYTWVYTLCARPISAFVRLHTSRQRTLSVAYSLPEFPGSVNYELFVCSLEKGWAKIK